MKVKVDLIPRQDLTAIVFFVLFATALVVSFNIEPIYSLAVAGAGALLWLFGQKPDWGLYLIALLFPFINLQFFIGEQVNIPYVDLVAIFVFIAWLLKLFWRWAESGKFIRYKDLPGIGAFLLFIGASLLSLFNAPEPLVSLKFILRPLAFFYLMFVILPYNLIRSREVLKNVLWVFWLVGMIISGIGLASIFVDQAGDFLRITPIAFFGIYPLGTNQNLIAESLVVIMPFAGVLALWEQERTRKRLLILSIILMGLVTLGTLSRAGLLTILLQLMIFVLYFFRKNLRQIVPVALIGLVISIPLIFYFSQLFASEISREATENRLLLTQIALDAFKENPLVGSGAGVYVSLVEVNRAYIKLFGNPIDSHGVIQKLLAETGLVGLFTFSLLVWVIVYRILKVLIKLPGYDPAKKVMLACLAVVLSGLFFQLFNTSYYVSKLWLPVGVALAATRLVEEKKI